MSKSSQPAHISVDESKDNKSSKTNISEGSELLITLGSSTKSTNNRINRKLVYEEPKSDRLGNKLNYVDVLGIITFL